MPTLAQQPTGGVLWLFRESFDVFTIALVLGSFVAVALIVRLVMETRPTIVAPEAPGKKIREQLDKNEPDRIDKVLRNYKRRRAAWNGVGPSICTPLQKDLQGSQATACPRLALHTTVRFIK